MEPADGTESSRGVEENFEKFAGIEKLLPIKCCKKYNTSDNETAKDAGGEDGTKGIATPKRGEKKVCGEEKGREVEGFSLIYIIYGDKKLFEGKEREEEKPDEWQGKLVVGTSGGDDGDEREVGAKKYNREGIEKEEAEFSQF